MGTTSHGWRPLFWFGAGPPVLFIIFRLCLPETNAFIERERVRASSLDSTKTFISETRVAIKHHWLTLVYLVLLLAGVNFMVSLAFPCYPFFSPVNGNKIFVDSTLAFSLMGHKIYTRPCSSNNTATPPTPSP